MNLVRGGASSSPASLFAASEPGVWYDPSDITTLFQDSAGTTPVTAPNQPVGLMLDKSQGLVLGSELVVNGDFSSGTTDFVAAGGNIVSIVGGRLRVTRDGSLNTYNGASITLSGLSSGLWYRLSIECISGTIPAYHRARQNSSGAAYYGDNKPSGTYTFLSTGTTMLLEVSSTSNSTTGYFEFDNISVKLLPGNHATQATAGQRPTYGINPITGTRNLLLQTQSAITLPWSFDASTGSGITLTGGLASDGTTQFAVFNEGTSVSAHRANQSVTVSAGATVTVSTEFKAGTSRYILLGTNRGGISIDTNDGTITQTIAAASTTTTNGVVTSLGGGLYRASVSVSHTTDTTIFYVISTATSSISGTMTPVFAGTSRTAVFTFAQFEASATATAYQKVVTQYEVTQAGVQSASYLSFDGVDDGMVTGTITPATDKVQVFAGVRKLSDASQSIVAEMSAMASANAGVFAFTAPNGAAENYNFISKGTTLQNNIVATYTSPITNVVSGLGDIAGPSNLVRVNGVQVGSTLTTQGTGNYLAYPLYIGRRGGTLNPFNGRIYSLIVRFGANLTTGQITSTESWVGGKTGVNIANNISPTIFARDDTAVLDRFNAIIERRA